MNDQHGTNGDDDTTHDTDQTNGQHQERSGYRHKPAFNIPEPNPIRGSNMIIEINPAMSLLLCEVLEDTELSEDESPVYALLKGMRRYHGRIAENKKARMAAQSDRD